MLEQTILQGFVGPFKIERQGNCLTYTNILQNLAAEVENDAIGCRRRTIRHLFLHDITRVDLRKIVTRRPFLGIAFAAESIFTGFERLECGGVIAEYLQPDPVVVVTALVDRQIGAPIFRITLKHDTAGKVKVADHVRPRSRRAFQPAVLQADTVFFKPVFGPCWHTANLFDQAAAGNTVGKVEFDGVIVDHLDLGDALAHGIRIRFQPLVQKQIVRKCNIMRGHGNAVRKPGLWPHGEFHPRLVGWIFNCLTQQAIRLAIFIGGQSITADCIPKQALECKNRKKMRAPLAGIGVHRIKCSNKSHRNLTALWGIRVHIVEMRIISRIAEIAVKTVPMTNGGLFLCLRHSCHDQTGSQRSKRCPADPFFHRLNAGGNTGAWSCHGAIPYLASLVQTEM